MAAKSTYELQAKLSVGLAIVGGLSALFAGFCILSRLDLQTFLFTYDPQGKRFLAVMAGLAMGMLTGGIGFLVGFNSAGQRLNKQNRLSWTGFFLSAAVIALTISCGILLFVTRNAVATQTLRAAHG
jgi:hypothetical protein